MNQSTRNLKSSAVAAICAGLALISTGCGKSGDTPDTGNPGPTASNKAAGALSIDGSTTVYPIVQAMGEDFKTDNSGVNVTVNKSGTGSGFQKFIRGDIDIATASRPIEAKEDTDLKAKGIDYIEIPIAYDGVSVVVNPKNTWADKLTTDELKNAWNSKSTVKLWSDIRPTFPKEKINFYGPTDNHGTYEYFTEAIDKKKGDIREDCQKNQEYNAIIQSVAGDKDGMAYVGFNYYDQNKDKVKIVPVDSGKGAITPSATTIADGTYTPLSRPLFLYVSKKAYDSKPQVKSFVQFALGDKGNQAVTESSYVLLPKDLHELILKHVSDEKTGTLFSKVTPGTKLTDLYSKVAGN